MVSPSELNFGEAGSRRRLGLFFALLVAVGAALFVGPTDIWGDWGELWAQQVFWAVRLPRVLAALFVGGALGSAGALMQGLFRNPLADPGLLGVSAGASLGALAALIILPTLWGALPLGAFLGALLMTGMILSLGKRSVAELLLVGLALNALAAAGVGLLLSISELGALRDYTFWVLGGLGAMNWESLGWLLPSAALVMLLSLREARALDVLALGEAEACSLGVNTQRLRLRVAVLAGVMVGVATAFCGIIAFVGLIAPHMARMFMGSSHRQLVPLSFLLGALLLLAADTGVRFLSLTGELPVGVLMALIGAPCFLVLLKQYARRGIDYV